MVWDCVRYYYKCPETGVEMHFTKDSEFGWCISIPREEDLDKKIDINKIPWPKLSDEEQKIVDDNDRRFEE